MASEDYTRDSARTYGRTWPRTVAEPSLFLNFTSATSLDPRITFSRGSQATLFDSTGTLVYAKHNLFLQSQTFQTSWTITRASISADATTAPDGTATADKLVEDTTASATHNITQSISFLAGVTYTYSIFVKAAERSAVRVLFPAAAFTSNLTANFDIATGAWRTSSPAPSAGLTLGVQDFSNGWYRISATATATAAATTTILLYLLDSPSSTGSYSGDGTSGLFIWGAQLNISNMEGGVTSSLSTYYPTTTAAYYAPRFDYNPSTLAPRGLLIEEQRTNSIRNNTMQGAVAGTPGTAPTNWVVSSSVSGITREIVGTGTENGITYIDIRYSGTPTANLSLAILTEANTQIVAANGQSWTGSWYVKLVGGAITNIGVIRINTSGLTAAGASVSGQAAAIDIQTLISSNALQTQRYAASFTFSSASVERVNTNVVLTVTNGNAVDITLRIGLPQLEQGAFATSVIPTTTTALTRNADAASMTGTNFSSWYSASEGTLYGEAFVHTAPNNGNIPCIFSIDDGTANNRIQIYRANNNAAPNLGFVVVSGGTVSTIRTTASTQSQPGKIAGAYKVDDFAASGNGSVPSTDTTGTVPVVTQAQIGNGTGSGIVNVNGWIQRISFYSQRLPNATLQALTA